MNNLRYDIIEYFNKLATTGGSAGDKLITGNGSDACAVLIGAGYTISAGGAVILKNGDPVSITGGALASTATQVDTALDTYEVANPGVIPMTWAIDGGQGAVAQVVGASAPLAGGIDAIDCSVAQAVVIPTATLASNSVSTSDYVEFVVSNTAAAADLSVSLRTIRS